MIKANGSLTLKADAEYGRFRIKCSTGETIPVDASGAPVGQVVFTFYKLDTGGTMAAFTADRVYYELLDAEGATLYDESLNVVERLDITADLKSYKGQVSSVNVIVYDGSGVMLANQSFGTTKPGADAEVYLLSLTEGHYLVDSDGKVDAKLAGVLYKKTGNSTMGVSGAKVIFGYSNGLTVYATTNGDGSWTDYDWFDGDDYTDTATCNSSPSIFARFELNGVVEAAQYVTLGQQGNDGASYEIVLDTGATVPCTAYAELKAANLIARLLKDGTPVNFDMFYVEIQDEHKTNINNYFGTHSMASYNLNTLFRQAVASGKAPYFIYTKAYVEGKVVTEKTFNVIYDTPFPFVRKETAWSAGLTFRNGDILILGANNVYMWNYPISGNSSVAPQTDVTENGTTTHWRVFDYFEMVATRILLAEYALVKNLGVEVIEMKDADGNILFQAKDGTVTCNTGNFNNINVQSGRIAGFKIAGNGLTNEGFGNDAYVTFRNDAKGCFAGIGGNVLPMSSGMRAVARFENGDTSDQWGLGRNIAMLLSATGGKYNHAFTGEGNGSLDGFVVGYRPNIMSAISSGVVIDYNKGNYVFITNYTQGNPGIILPRLTDIRNTLGIGSGVNFALPLTVCGYISTQGFKIVGRNGVTGQSTVFPKLRNKSNGDIESISMAGSDVLNLLLIYDGGEYYAFTVSFNS